MGGNIVIYRSKSTPIEKQKVEIVERKGLGHPDYIADSIAESFSRKLSLYYLEKFGKVLHHNVDKLEIIGGETMPEFGGGKIVKPISVLFSGRATDSVGESIVPTKDIAISSAQEWLQNNMRFVDPGSLRYIFETKSGSANLASAFNKKGKIGSNDTSFGVGYAPLSEAESTVFGIERFVNSAEFKTAFPFSGEDVKVMCVRKGNVMDITMAIAFIDRFVSSVSDYFDKKAKILDALSRKFDVTALGRKIKIRINCMDDKKLGKNGCYLTVTGSSSEHGDDGAVGRGNRVNGLITPNRPMSLEAAAGKNPINHVGKIYNLLAVRLSAKLYNSFTVPVYARIVGRIGSPLDKPLMISIETFERISSENKKKMLELINDELSSIPSITKDLLDNKASIC